MGGPPVITLKPKVSKFKRQDPSPLVNGKRGGQPPDPILMEAADELRHKPGEWHNVRAYDTRGAGYKAAWRINSGKAGWAPRGTWEATIRSRPGSSKCDLYLMYKGEGQ